MRDIQLWEIISFQEQYLKNIPNCGKHLTYERYSTMRDYSTYKKHSFIKDIPLIRSNSISRTVFKI